MIIFKKADVFYEFLQKEKSTQRKIGFVPTMGALHTGHLSLISKSKLENDITVCSIFINPTQFNNKEDFAAYPVMVEKDIAQLISAECDILFLPSENEIYSENYKTTHYDLGHLEHILEGKFRPGHFQGVCQVVERLLTITQPHSLYLGQKDYQQCLIIKRLIQILGMQSDVCVKICETQREPDGLAMSSRNLRLNEAQRKKANHIFKTLLFIKENFMKNDFGQLKKIATRNLEARGFKVDYVEIADTESLQPSSNSTTLIALIAASLDKVRLIDNLVLN